MKQGKWGIALVLVSVAAILSTTAVVRLPNRRGPAEVAHPGRIPMEDYLPDPGVPPGTKPAGALESTPADR